MSPRDDNDRLRDGDLPADPFEGAAPMPVSDTLSEVDALQPLRDLPAECTDAARDAALHEVARNLVGRDALALGCSRTAMTEEFKRRAWPAPAKLASEVVQQAELAARQERAATGEGDKAAQHGLEDPEPWPDPVRAGDLLEVLVALFEKYVVLPAGASLMLAVWVLHTWTAHAAAEFSARINITSATMRCGKSQVLKVLRAIVRRPLKGDGMTAAVVFRLIEAFSPTILLDEADTLGEETAEALRAVLNAGFERSGVLWRCVGDTHEPSSFAVFGPFAIARIGRLPATVEDRGVVLRMRRKRKDEKVARLRKARLWSETEDLRRKLARWSQDAVASLSGAEPSVPAALDDRAADLWEPLLAIADHAGGEWPAAVRRAALLLSANRDADASDGDVKTLALHDLRDLFHAHATDRLASEVVAEAFAGMEDRPWSEWGRTRKPLTKAALAKLLRGFDIRPRSIRLADDSTPKGYLLSACEDAFNRWLGELDSEDAEAPGLAPSPAPDRHTATNATNGLPGANRDRHSEPDVAPTDPSQSPVNGPCGGVAVRQGASDGLPAVGAVEQPAAEPAAQDDWGWL